jgi:ATP-binding cassette subfamily G (WHITE) protein 2 (SNQ2)
MLEVIGAGNPDYKGKDWGDVWVRSEENKHRTEEIQEIVNSRRNQKTGEETKDDREYAMSVWTQILATTKRSFVTYWRSPEYIIVGFSFINSVLTARRENLTV